MAVSVPLGTTFTRLPFPGTSTFTSLQTCGGMDQELSDSWAKGVLKDLISVQATSQDFPLTNLRIIFPKKDDIVNKSHEVLALYKVSEEMIRDKMNPIIQTAFFDRLVFDDERSYFEISGKLFDKLATLNRISYFVKHKKLIEYIIGITSMMKKQDSLIEEFYTMSATCLRIGKTTSTNMLENILKDIEKLSATPDARIFMNKVYFLAINIDTNLKQFNHLVNKTPPDILDIIHDVFRPEGF
jgi:hypothetical protein